MYRVDLHTHSEASRDGGITPDQYAETLQNEVLDVIAITDHNRIDFARGMQKALGADRIIVGEEITTLQGEIIGLYLTEKVEPGMSAQDTIDAIKAQNGIVYIPHPFEKVRQGISVELLEALKQDVDIVEGYNGRAMTQRLGLQAIAFVKKYGIAVAASSDAHGVAGLGRTYTRLKSKPNRNNITEQLLGFNLVYRRPPLYTFLLPKLNLIRNKIRGNNQK